MYRALSPHYCIVLLILQYYCLIDVTVFLLSGHNTSSRCEQSQQHSGLQPYYPLILGSFR